MEQLNEQGAELLRLAQEHDNGGGQPQPSDSQASPQDAGQVGDGSADAGLSDVGDVKAKGDAVPGPDDDKAVSGNKVDATKQQRSTDGKAGGDAASDGDAAKAATSKFAKEQARKAKTWEQINAEREALKAEKEALARERDEFTKNRESRPKDDVEGFRDARGLAASDYEAAAKAYEADGDKSMAEQAMKKANEVRNAAREHVRKAEEKRHGDALRVSFETMAKDRPWLKDDNHALNRRTSELLTQFPGLLRDAKGLENAVYIAETEAKAADATKLQDEVKALKAQIDSLQKKTQIGRGTPSRPPAAAKPFGELSLQEQRQALLAKAAEFDGASG